MALTKCKECEMEISHEALVCPHCGGKTETWHQIQKNKKIKNENITRFIIFILLDILIGVGIIYNLFIIKECLICLIYDKPFIPLFLSSIAILFGIFGGIGLIIWLTKSKKVARFLILGGTLYLVFILVNFGMFFKNNVMPAQEFRKVYMNSNSLGNLQDKKLDWGGIFITFNGDNVTFGGEIQEKTFPIDKINENGKIFIKCNYWDIKTMFGQKFNQYFREEKVSYQYYSENKNNCYFILEPSVTSLDYRVEYNGVNYEPSSITYSGGGGYYPTMGAQSAAKSALNIKTDYNNDGGWNSVNINYSNHKGWAEILSK